MALDEFLSEQPSTPGAPRLVDGGIVMAAVAALALGGKAEFALIAELPKDVERPVLPDFARFGYAVDAQTGEVLPPGEVLSVDRRVYASFRLSIPAVEAQDEDERQRKLEQNRQAVLRTLERVSANGWALQIGEAATTQDDRSAAAIRAQADQLPALPEAAGGRAPDGAGVLVGVVDFGCDFAHPAFRRPDGSTRLRFLWDQNATPSESKAVPGKVHDRAAIDAALGKEAADGPEAPFNELGYQPDANLYIAVNTPDDAPVHGTHVLGVAAGRAVPPSASGRADRGCPAGVAPGAELAFVHLRPGALVSDGDPADVLDGVCAIFEHAEAGNLPAVVNLSLGANFGPHDGSTLLDRALDALLQKPRRAIVVAAGNAGAANRHAGGNLNPGEERTIEWRFLAGDATPNTLRVFCPAPEGRLLLGCAFTSPSDRVLLEWRPPRGGNCQILDHSDRTFGALYGGLAPAIGGVPMQQVEVRLTPSGAVDETWKVTVRLPADAAGPVRWDAWIERDDRARSSSSEDRATPTLSSFAPEDAVAASTLSAIACGDRTICVGAFEETAADGRQAAGFTALGPTRDERQKPDLAAPGAAVTAARARGGRVFGLFRPLAGEMGGTSVAAPHVAGVAALMLQARPDLTAEKIGAALRETTQVPEGAAAREWDARLGFGVVDAAAAVAKVMAG